MKHRLALLCAVLGLCCDSPHPNPPPQPNGGSPAPEPVCDDTATLKLRLFMPGQNERELRGSMVRIENGMPSFALDGQCKYWMGGGWFEDRDSRDLGWRHGEVDDALRRALDQTFTLHDLTKLRDCKSSVGLFDAAPRVIASEYSVAVCLVPGPRFEAAWSVIEARASELWQRAEPLQAGLWVSAADSGDDSPAYPWPLAEPLANFLVNEQVPESEYTGFRSGVGHLVSAREAVEKLRALRDRYLADSSAEPGRFFDAPKVSDGERSARVYMRDAIPYEDERGLLPFMPRE